MATLDMQGITKRFGEVVANQDVNFTVEQSEIHALVGENGAGKSTLMKILYGLQQPDSGSIVLNGQAVSIPNPQTAIQLGIGMVHQHFQLVPSLTVAENVALGYEPLSRGVFVDRHQMQRRIADLSEQFGLRVDPKQTVADLSVGERQRVEILKLLYREARLLILDEPTAVLTPQEVEVFFEIVQRLVAEGRTAVLITHKLREVMAICSRATVLRRGRNVGTVQVSDSSPAEIARMMVGSDIVPPRRQSDTKPGNPVLTLHQISAQDDRGLPALQNISFTVHGGEIVGLAGVEGNGQFELLEVISGLRPPTEGRVLIDDQDCTRLDNRKRRKRGFALIPEDRNLEGVSPPMSLWENMAADRYYRPPQSHAGFMHIRRLQQQAADLMQRFDVRAEHQRVPVQTLSGGNAQKVIIARELTTNPRVLVAAQPTRGLDVGAAGFVHEQLLDLRSQGVGVLLLSADLDELLAICDRFVVLFNGQVAGELNADEATRERLGLLMAGRGEDSVS
jgi:ABC-type uncharacterized transport system ATPase subunit